MIIENLLCFYLYTQSFPVTLNYFLWLFHSISSDERESNFLPPIEARNEGKDGSEEDPYSWRKTNYYRSMTSQVLERSSKEPKSWVRL